MEKTNKTTLYQINIPTKKSEKVSQKKIDLIKIFIILIHSNIFYQSIKLKKYISNLHIGLV